MTSCTISDRLRPAGDCWRPAMARHGLCCDACGLRHLRAQACGGGARVPGIAAADYSPCTAPPLQRPYTGVAEGLSGGRMGRAEWEPDGKG